MIFYLILIDAALASSTESLHEFSWNQKILLISITFCLILFAGAMSGLTVGLMSFSVKELESKIMCGTDQELKYAKRVLPIVSKHHLLLVTLLLGNTIAMETLPIMLEMMVGGGGAILISVPMLMIFGEVLPQAFCTGPDKLMIASKLVPLVNIVTYFLYPLSYPISLFLDRLLGKGEEPAQNGSLTELHSITDSKCSRSINSIGSDEITEENTIGNESINKYIKPIEQTFKLSISCTFTKKTLKVIKESKHSKVLIHNEKDEKVIEGILLTKELIGIDEGVSLKSPEIHLEAPLFIKGEYTIFQALNAMHQNEIQIAIIVDENSPRNKSIGIITLKDIMDVIHNRTIGRDKILDEKNENDIDKNQSFAKENESAFYNLKKYIEMLSVKYFDKRFFNQKVKL
ncbi:unnamed protein product [Blepharisma stoltei]|uniref:CNNM transmembrane domain-containing protein n=1 Tax=Blepharisma stoltei TaxID=1481888 RepID=A0AAU9J290_9CILI|nr:unnamed protein product [Blepharisma stoltei]